MVGKKKVVCVGCLTLDALALVEGYPDKDSRVEAELVQIGGGGPAANAAVVLARQGEDVRFVGRVGNDTAGRQTLALLKAEGVDCSGVSVVEEAMTQASVIVVDRTAGTRAISTQRMPVWEELDDRAKQIVADADWIHVDHLGFNPVKNYLAQNPTDAVVSLDAGNPVAGMDLEFVTVYVPTVGSLAAQFGLDKTDADLAAQKAINAGAGAVVATAGSKGSMAWWSDRSADIGGAESAGAARAAAHDDVEIVSTLGAGDVYHGGLVAALLRGESWEEALNSANITAEMSCAALDGREAVPTLTELKTAAQRYRKNVNSTETEGSAE